MKTKTTLFLLVSAFCINAYAQSPWTNYTNDRLISDVHVDGQDIWVGSQGGLTRTNMETGDFQTYLPYNSPIIGGGIKEIEQAPDNSLWFLSENAGVFQLKNGEWTNYYDGIVPQSNHETKNLQILPNGDVWLYGVQFEDQSLNNLIRIRDGVVQAFGNLPEDLESIAVLDEQAIFISNGDTIHRYDVTLEQVIEVYHSGNSILPNEEWFREIIIDRNGALILASDSGIYQLKNGGISLLSTPGLVVNKAFKDSTGNVFLQSYHNDPNAIRLAKYDGSTVTYFKDEDFMPYPAADLPRFRGAGPDGKLYAVVWNLDTEHILFRFDENGWTPVKTQIVPLLDNYQVDVQSDCEGNLWFTSRDGVDVRYADGTWEHFHIEGGNFMHFSHNTMTVDPVTCDVWFANSGNQGGPNIPGIMRISNGNVTQFLHGHSSVHDIEATVDGKVYFFSGESGFGYIENDAIHYIDQLDEFDFVNSIESDSKGNVYLAVIAPELIKYDGIGMTQLGVGELGDYIFDLYVDNNDLVWVYFADSVKQFDGFQWTDYSDIWAGIDVNDMVQDRRGNYWVSTWNDGLYYWDKQSLQQYTIFNSDLSTDRLRGVALDPDGNLIVTQWVGASVWDIPDITEAYRGTGHVFFDAAQNGVFDSAEDILVPGQKIRDTDRDLWSVTNIYGKYAFYGDAPETYNYLHELEAGATSTTGNPQSAGFENYQSILPDFGFWKPNVPEVKLSIVNGVPVCNRDFRVQVFLRNNSAYTTTGDLTLTFNEILTLNESSIPVSQQTGGQIVFEDLSALPYEIFDIKLGFTAPGITEEGIALLFQGIFNISDSSFTGISFDSVLCSYDPNDKKVEPTGDYYNDYSLIKDPLKYTIRFQNEGTYKAFDIRIVDTLDQHLDPSTFELLGSSHAVETTITADGIVTFNFPNIDLPTRADDEPGSQGFVSFTVQPDNDLENFERIYNNASIYFDFNPPIVTNTTEWNLVDDLAIVSTTEAKAEFSIYPNPTEGTLILTIEKEADYYIWDGAGRQNDSGRLQEGRNIIQLDIPTGIYYLQVKGMESVYGYVKVVVMR